MSEKGMLLALQLRACADALEKHDQMIWSQVCGALDKGNRNWAGKLGFSYAELAVIEIERLYGIEKLSLKALDAGHRADREAHHPKTGSSHD